MNIPDETQLPPAEAKTKKQLPKKRKKRSGAFGRFLRRTLLLLFTLVLLALAGAGLLLNTLLNGPSPTMRDLVTATLLDHSETAWIPGLFLEPGTLEQIRSQAGAAPADTVSDPGRIQISHSSEPWLDCPEGIRLAGHTADTFRAQVLLVRDPGSLRVVSGTDTSDVMTRNQGTAAVSIGTQGQQAGYAGFTEEGILIVSTFLTEGENFPGIQEGAATGPVLILNGTVNQAVYGANSGLAPRCALGQRSDGTVILAYLSAGTYRELTDVLVEYGAVNACSLSCGSGSSLSFRDSAGQLHTFPETEQTQSFSTADFWLVLPSEEG